MYETIILAVCLTHTPAICKEVDLSVEPDPTGSLQLLFHCARRGQIEAQRAATLAEVGAPQLERSALGPRPAVKAANKIVEGATLIPALEWSNLELLKCFEGFEDPELDLACQ